jgi:hypothetical protein
MSANPGRRLIIVADGIVVSSPVMAGVISDGKLPIDGLGYFVARDFAERIKRAQRSGVTRSS